MESLRELDKIAYVRFASVYRDFQDEAGVFQRAEEPDAAEAPVNRYVEARSGWP